MKNPLNHPLIACCKHYNIEDAARLIELLIEVHHASKGDWVAWCEKRQEAWSAEVEQILGEYEMEAPE